MQSQPTDKEIEDLLTKVWNLIKFNYRAVIQIQKFNYSYCFGVKDNNQRKDVDRWEPCVDFECKTPLKPPVKDGNRTYLQTQETISIRHITCQALPKGQGHEPQA